MRTIVELPRDQLDALGRICREKGISRAEAVRRAVAVFIDAAQATSSHAAFGLWGDRAFNSVRLERDLRGDWDGRVR